MKTPANSGVWEAMWVIILNNFESTKKAKNSQVSRFHIVLMQILRHG